MGKSLFPAAILFAFLSMSGATNGAGIAQADLNTGLSIADNGKLVRVRGVIDACRPDYCFICPSWEKASREDEAVRRTGCIALSGWKDTGAGLLLDELYRFSDVEITARFHFEAPDRDVNVFCLDQRRCSQNGFEDVTINTLYERRPVEKLSNNNPSDAVIPISSSDDAALRKLFWNDRDFTLVYLDGPEVELRTYTRPVREPGSPQQGWLCYPRKSVPVNTDDPFPWPTGYRAIELRSPANPYRCRLAWKEKGVWRIVRELQKLPVYGLD